MHYKIEDVSRIFGRQPGFEMCRVRIDKQGANTAFIDFVGIKEAMDARDRFNNKIFDGQELQIQFARDIGRKRNRTNNASSSAGAGASASGGASSGAPSPQSSGYITLFVEGVPADATEREMGHIFRPFEGYAALRLAKPRTKLGRDVPLQFVMCFVDFKSRSAALGCMEVCEMQTTVVSPFYCH